MGIEDVQSGNREILASINDLYQGPHTARCFFNPKGIDFGIRSIYKSASVAILVIDEVGHLELSGEGFAGIHELCKVSTTNDCILVIRKRLLPAFLPRLPVTPLIFETTISNRDQLPREIGLILLKKLG